MSKCISLSCDLMSQKPFAKL